MKEYSNTADASSIAAFIELATPWVSHSISSSVVEIRLNDGAVVRIDVSRGDHQHMFETFRLAGTLTGPHGMSGVDPIFPRGLRRVALLRTIEWVAPAAESSETLLGRNAQEQGSATSEPTPPNVIATSLVDDALLLESWGDDRLLIRADWPPYNIVVERDPETIDAIVAEREVIDLL